MVIYKAPGVGVGVGEGGVVPRCMIRCVSMTLPRGGGLLLGAGFSGFPSRDDSVYRFMFHLTSQGSHLAMDLVNRHKPYSSHIR